MRFVARLFTLLPAALLAALFVPATAAAEVRIWTSADGQFTTRAEFLDFQDQKVILRREDGKEVAVPVTALSPADRSYVRSEVLRRRKAAPPAPSKAAVPPRATASAGGDWPRWRGPHIDGKSAETGLLPEWPEEGPPLVWQAEGLGTGYAGVSIVGGKIFTMGRQGGQEHLLTLDARDGSIVWSTPVGPGQNQRGSNCTPTVDGELVYGVSIEGDLICARAATGQPVWQKNYARDFGGKMMSSWGFSESPLVDGRLLVCTPGGQQAMLAALDKLTGQVVWTTAMPPGGREGAGYSSIVVSHGGGVKQYVQLVGRGLIGVAADSGQLLWAYDRIANDTANIPTAIVSGDYVFCSSGYGTGAALLKLSSGGGRVRMEEQYFLPANKFQNHHGGMVLVDGYVYAGDGHNEGFPICLELQTGAVRWGGDARGAGKRSAAVLYADGNLYFRYEDGTMALIQATPERYNLKSSFKLASVRAESWPHPVIVGGKLYLRDQEVLMCYDVKQR